jgi:hypothetical protein
VLLSKCSKHGKTFGIRVEKRGNDWIRTWIFPISDDAARREGFDKTNITASFNVTKEFPWCPYCGTHGMFFLRLRQSKLHPKERRIGSLLLVQHTRGLPDRNRIIQRQRGRVLMNNKQWIIGNQQLWTRRLRRGWYDYLVVFQKAGGDALPR